MAEIQKGIGVVWGLSSTKFEFSATAVLAELFVTPTGETLRRSARKVEVSDKGGQTIGLIFVNPTNELDLEVFPCDISTPTLAGAIANNILPAVGDKFVITDADDTNIVGTYIVEECSKMKKNDNYVSFTVKIIRYPTDLSLTMT